MFIIKTIILSLTICIDSFILCLLSKTKKKRYLLFIPFIFSFTQTLFLYLGYSLGSFIEVYLKDYLRYIVFFIFSFMALKLIVDTFLTKDKETDSLTSLTSITIQAVLTSFDSLFLGIPFAFNSSKYFLFILILGITTFLACLFALLLRNKISITNKDKINLISSIILLFFAFKSIL